MTEETVFTEAMEIADPKARAAFLDRACSGNPDVRVRLDKLLAEHAQAGSFLGSPAPFLLATDIQDNVANGGTQDIPAARRDGTAIGPYKLVEVIGEGGMGTVWLAQQQEPVKRLVALKVIKAGMDSRSVLARFEAERQALALMDHPNIAKVLDAGATPDGRPYFVMELVKGVPITKFCDERRLTPRERMELFVPVCQAVQHAHQKGVIHRDIKPSNVMVALYDGRPVPKVIDFGIAKAAGQPLTEKTLVTGLGTVVGTPEYMSPEQAELNQLDIDTRSDIYSLGILLYELLTGTTPLQHKRVKEAALLEVLRLVREEEPPRPSTRISTTDELPSIAARRGTEPGKLSGLVRGELDWIVMKALEKDRNRRYETANGFGMDVQRYLAGEAVQAVPPSVGYQLRKFARRNKRGLTTVAMMGVMLVLGVALLVFNNVQLKEEQQHTAAQKTRAETALGEAKDNLQLADENLGLALEALDEVYMNEIERRVLQKRELTPANRDFLHKGLRFYEQFGKRNSTHTGLLGATAKANRRAGYLRIELEHWDEAEEHFRKAIPLLDNLVAVSPLAAEHRRELASARHGLAVGLRRAGRPDDAEISCRQAVALRQQLAADFPAERDDRVRLAHSLWELAEILLVRGRHPDAEEPARHALGVFEQFKAAYPDELYYRQETAMSRRILAYTLWAQGRHPEALENFRRSVDLYAGLVADSPSNPFFRQELAFSYAALGDVLKESGRHQEAENAYRDSVAVWKQLAADSNRPEDRTALARAEGSLAAIVRQARLDEAVAASRTAIELDPKIANAHSNLGLALSAQGKLDDAVAAIRKAIELDPTLAIAHCNLGSVLSRQNKWEEATDAYRKAIELDPRHALAHTGLGYILHNQNRWADAIEAYRTAIEFDPKIAAAHYNLGDCLKEQGKLAQAIVAFERVIELEPDHAFRHDELAWLLASSSEPKLRNPERAVELARRAVKLEPEDSSYWHTLGVAYYRMSKWGESLEALEKSCGLEKTTNGQGNARQWLWLAMVHWQMGNSEEARSWYDKAVQSEAVWPEELVRFEAEAGELLGVPLAQRLESALLEGVRQLVKAEQWDQAAALLSARLEGLPRETGAGWDAPRRRLCRTLAQWDEVFRRVVELRPQDADLWIGRGRHFAFRSDWNEAAAAYERAVPSQPLTDEGFEYACLLLLREDRAGFRQWAQRVAELAAGSRDRFELFVAVRTCAMTPEPVVPAPRLVEWAEQMAGKDPNAWYLHALGAAYYRAGDFEKALETLRGSNASDWNEVGKAKNWLILAMGQHRLGRADEARQSRDEARRRIAEATPTDPGAPALVGVGDWLGVQVLRMEAEALLAKGPQGSEPRPKDPAAAASPRE